jgi:uncharacterized protein YlxW (UPF0749 family)
MASKIIDPVLLDIIFIIGAFAVITIVLLMIAVSVEKYEKSKEKKEEEERKLLSKLLRISLRLDNLEKCNIYLIKRVEGLEKKIRSLEKEEKKKAKK